MLRKFPSIRRITTSCYIRQSVTAGLPNTASQDNLEEIQFQKDGLQTLNPFARHRFLYPEFLPNPKYEWRNKLRERLERNDMLKRRNVIEIPEFYVGSILAVTVTDPNATNKSNRFVGICINRSGVGLRTSFILRNVVDHQGVEIMYELYSPLICKVEVLRLEKRLDESLFYLRDALPEYSTFPFDMEPEPHLEGTEVPVNPIKVKLRPRPWLERWERQNLQGVQDLGLEERFYKRAEELATPWEKYDLMKDYRSTIPEEEQIQIYSEIHPVLQQQEQARRNVRRRKTSSVPLKG